MRRSRTQQAGYPVTPQLVELREDLAAFGGRTFRGFDIGDVRAEFRRGDRSLWLLLRRARKGGVALRTASWAGAGEPEVVEAEPGETVRIRVRAALGEFLVIVTGVERELTELRVTVRFTPAAATFLPYVPRDLFPLDVRDEPFGTQGVVEAKQRGINTGLLYFRLEEPRFGTVLYVQNFTPLNSYFRATGTNPADSVGGCWPELGFELPIQPSGKVEEAEPLAAGETVTLSDAILVLRPDLAEHERDSARRFLQMLGAAYRHLELPATDFRDWTARARATLRDLDAAPEATIRHYGHRYIHPYTAAEYPDAMVQMSIVQALHEWGRWQHDPHPLEAEFMAGMSRFYDAKLGTIRRYLPNVGKDKDAEAVDSWYLYHPLLNLGRLALDGDRKAKRLFLRSLDYAVRAAHHFSYRWPIQYKVTDFSVIDKTAGADGRGQTDVGGIYAWVMLQAYELTDDSRFLDEARAAIDAAIGLGFGLNYQANLTAWGAAACMRLWRATNRDVYREQSYVYLASFFHNCEIWESEIGHAVHSRNFLGVTCLQDAPYMAIYECFDSYAAFEHFLIDSGPDLEPAARMLIAEYCRYALDRAWFYYPDALPPEAISDEQRENNGHVDRKLSFPLEDLYADGQPAGQVGQEIYGAGAAFIFATRAFHPVEGAPFLLFCDHFIRASERTGERTISIQLDGGEACHARLSFVRLGRKLLPTTYVSTADGDRLRGKKEGSNRIDYTVPANGRVILSWEP
jgi:hypothetical protein